MLDLHLFVKNVPISIFSHSCLPYWTCVTIYSFTCRVMNLMRHLWNLCVVNI